MEKSMKKPMKTDENPDEKSSRVKFGVRDLSFAPPRFCVSFCTAVDVFCPRTRASQTLAMDHYKRDAKTTARKKSMQ